MAAVAQVRPLNLKDIRSWQENQLWTAFLLLDAIHDYGDTARSNSDSFDWFMKQPIPEVLRETIQAIPEASPVTMQEYASAFLGFVPKMGSKVEKKLAEQLVTRLPKRMNVQKELPPAAAAVPPLLTEAELKKFKIFPTRSMFSIPCTSVQSIMEGDDALIKQRLIRTCCALGVFRLDESGFNNERVNPSFEEFFKRILTNSPDADVAAISVVNTNYDASPSIYRYLNKSIKQKYTPLNLLDSATSSSSLGFELAENVGILLPGYAYKRYLTTQAPNPIVTSIQVSGDPSTTISVTTTFGYVNVLPFTENVDVVSGDDPNIISKSGPTLGYLSKLIQAILQQAPVNRDALKNIVNDIARKSRAAPSPPFTLQNTIGYFVDNHPSRDIATIRNDVIRFLFEWKGFGDAEQVRFAATQLAGITEKGDNVLAVDPNRLLPPNALLMGTVDENSWMAMRLSGITCCYSNHGGGFHDIVVFPTKVRTPGQILYARFTYLTSRMNEVLTLASKFGDGTTVNEVLTNIGHLLTSLKNVPGADNGRILLQSFNVANNVVNDYFPAPAAAVQPAAVQPAAVQPAAAVLPAGAAAGQQQQPMAPRMPTMTEPEYRSGVVRFLRQLLTLKFKNAYDFFKQVQSVQTGFADVGRAATPVLTVEQIDNLTVIINEADANTFFVDSMNVKQFCDTVDTSLNSDDTKTALSKAQPILDEFSAVKLHPTELYPATIFQTQVVAPDGKILPNPILRFETGHYKTVFLFLTALKKMYISGNIDDTHKQFNLFEGALFKILDSFYKQTGTPANGSRRFNEILSSRSKELRAGLDSYRREYTAGTATRESRATIQPRWMAEVLVVLSATITDIQANVPGTPEADRGMFGNQADIEKQVGGGQCDYTEALEGLYSLAAIFQKLYQTIRGIPLKWFRVGVPAQAAAPAAAAAPLPAAAAGVGGPAGASPRRPAAEKPVAPASAPGGSASQTAFGGRRKTPRKRVGRQTYRRKFVD